MHLSDPRRIPSISRLARGMLTTIEYHMRVAQSRVPLRCHTTNIIRRHHHHLQVRSNRVRFKHVFTHRPSHMNRKHVTQLHLRMLSRPSMLLSHPRRIHTRVNRNRTQIITRLTRQVVTSFVQNPSPSQTIGTKNAAFRSKYQ